MKADRKRIEFYNEKRGDKNFAFLSNFHPSPFQVDDKVYFTSEHYFQSQKFVPFNLKAQQSIIKTEKPGTAFRLAQQYSNQDRQGGLNQEYWKLWVEGRNIEVMREALALKFGQNQDLKQKLLATKNSELVEDSPTDSFWGIGKKKTGQNMLGKLLMEYRDKELKSSIKDGSTLVVEEVKQEEPLLKLPSKKQNKIEKVESEDDDDEDNEKESQKKIIKGKSKSIKKNKKQTSEQIKKSKVNNSKE